MLMDYKKSYQLTVKEGNGKCYAQQHLAYSCHVGGNM